jgi:hypothetical protein
VENVCDVTVVILNYIENAIGAHADNLGDMVFSKVRNDASKPRRRVERLNGSNQPINQARRTGRRVLGNIVGDLFQVVFCPFSPEDLSNSAILLFTSS